jgi:hypothetical protein
MQPSADSNKNNSSFDDKPSPTFQLVVALINWISKGISSLYQIKAKQTCKQRTTLDEDPRPISTLVIFTS